MQLARVLHDSVAHEVTGMVLEVQAAQVSAHEPGESRALLSRLEEAGLRALDSMDRTLRTLHSAEESREDAAGEDPAQPSTRVHGVADLPELVGRFAESGAVKAELDLDDEVAGALPREIDEAVYLLVLEALTNVRRHAAAARDVRVTVERAGAELRVRVVNAGGGSSSSRCSPAPQGRRHRAGRTGGAVPEPGRGAGGGAVRRRLAGGGDALPPAAPTASSGNR